MCPTIEGVWGKIHGESDWSTSPPSVENTQNENKDMGGINLN